MKRITFKTDNGETFERVTRTIAKKAFEQGKTVYMCPDQSKPEVHGVRLGSERTVEEMEDGELQSYFEEFEEIEDNFRFYACNKENGLRIAYYIELVEKPPREAEFITLPKGTIFRVTDKNDKFVKLETVANGGQNAVNLTNGRMVIIQYNEMTEEVDE